MCGQFSLVTPAELIENRFNVTVDKELYKPSATFYPGQKVAVISNNEPEKLSFFKWGLIPYWAKYISIGSNLINARSETIFEKPSFKNSLKSKRCLILSDGFYEWKKTDTGKQKYIFTVRERELFAFAGLWDVWENPEDGNLIYSCTIITTVPNQNVAEVHDRMPVILNKENESKWISQELKTSEIEDLLIPCGEDLINKMTVWQ